MAPRKGSESDTAAKSLIGPEILKRVATVNAIEAELRSLSRLVGAAGQKNAPVGDMSSRRGELIQKLRKEQSKSAFRRTLEARRASNPNIQSALNSISQLLGWCNTLAVPVMAEGINQTPGIAGTQGEIGTAGIFGGGVAFGGTPEDDGTHDPNTEKWWIHNWNSTAVFPAAASDGTISYKFGISNETDIYQAYGNSGSVTVFVTVGTTGDVNQPISNWQTVGWPTDIPLPQGHYYGGGGFPVTGTIPVKGGKSAALGLIFGAIVSVASGLCMFLPTSNIWTGIIRPPGQQSQPGDYGKIEYCFNPTWWYHALEQRMLIPQE